MHQHSREGRRHNAARAKNRRASKAKRGRPRGEGHGFAREFETLCGKWIPKVGRRRGRKPRVGLKAVLMALVFHVMQRTGTLGEHFSWLMEDSLCDSACSDRRQRLPWEVFEDLMCHALRPLARRGRHKESFWRGWRLV